MTDKQNTLSFSARCTGEPVETESAVVFLCVGLELDCGNGQVEADHALRILAVAE